MTFSADADAVENIVFGADALRDPAQSLRREWLITNGLGGYASGTLATANTRRYHGLLVAALNPPVGRAVLLSKLEETLRVTDASGKIQDYALSANLYPGATYPQGYQWLRAWNALPAPTWQWSPSNGVTLEKKVWMAQGKNTTYIAYRLLALPPDCTARLSLVPLLAWRDYHSEMMACDFRPAAAWYTPSAAGSADAKPGGALRLSLPPIARVTNAPTDLTLQLCSEDGSGLPDAVFDASPEWYYHFQQPREQERGLDYQEDLYTPGTLSASLTVGSPLCVVATAHAERADALDTAWNALLARQTDLLQGTNGANGATGTVGTSEINGTSGVVALPGAPSPSADAAPAPDAFGQQLTLAADQFVVQVPGGRATVIAGYPWFGDWGRDTMIALPGLCLTTGRAPLARDILVSFAAFADQGMLPNRFPDVGETPEYNTVDATLWYFVAIYRYIEATGDVDLLRQTLWSVLQDIIDWHRRGTRYNIHVDAADGLLYAGQAGVQLTWMDAKVGDWVVTPRIGKPVEINALWYCALRIMAHFATLLNDDSAPTYTQQAQAMQAAFARRFTRADGQGLYDVLDTPGEGAGNADASIRPNQIFALSLPFPVVEANAPLAQSIIDIVRAHLLTPNGLRTLSPQHPAYRPRYEGDPLSRDGAYHQGTVWPWLLGPFAQAVASVTGDITGARAMLAGLQPQLAAFGMGSLAEIYDASDPQRPNGCYGQAWSVAETLRVWQDLNAQQG